jgi:hypothetical protein
MKTIVTQKRIKLIVLSAFFISTLFFSACRVTFVPKYDAKIKEQIEDVAKSIDKFYLIMLETTTEADGGRAYGQFVHEYIDIEVELNSLLVKNEARTKNTEMIENCKYAIELFERHKNRHKENNTISDGVIQVTRLDFKRAMQALMISETGKMKAE